MITPRPESPEPSSPRERLRASFFWLGTYSRADLQADLVAGLTVGVVLVPQSMGYAMIAGLPPLHGLYASLVPLVVYALLGTSRQLAAGVVALDMLIVAAGASRVARSPQDALVVALTLAMMVGVIHLAIGALRLGFIAEFISRPVIVGFVTAAPLLIGLGQLDELLGLPAADSHHLVSLVADIGRNLDAMSLASLLLGLVSLLVLLGLRRVHRALPAALIALALGGGLVWALGLRGEVATVAGAGAPMARAAAPFEVLPALDPRLWRSLLPTALTLVLIQLVTVVSINKTTASLGNGPSSANRELAAIGASNLLGSFAGSTPVSASFSRTALNVQAGAASPLANGFAALVVGVAILALGGLMAWIPRPTLAAVIMVAAFALVDFGETRRIFELRRAEGYLALFTFAATLLIGIEEGVLLGIGASMVQMLYRASRPHVAELGRDPQSNELRELGRASGAVPIDGVVVLRVDGSLSFASADFTRRVVLERVEEDAEQVQAVVIDARGVNDLDTSAVSTLHELLDRLEEHGVRLYLTNVKGRVRELIERSDIDDRLGNATLRVRNRDVLAELARKGIAPPEAATLSTWPPLAAADAFHGAVSRIQPDGAVVRPAARPPRDDER